MTALLTPDELKSIVDAALACQLEAPDRRPLLLAGIPSTFTASLPHQVRPLDLLRSDLNALNQVAALDGLDQPPLALWLHNAEQLATPRPQAQTFQQLRTRLTSPRPTPTTPQISTHRLPGASSVFVGRDTELAMLETAWTNPRTRVQSLIAWGGAGKTALMRHWLNALADRGYDGAARVYAWSFYSQGASEGRQSSADLFIDQMLRWLGDAEPEAGDPWQKGERLVGLIRKQKTLLLLDGVEPLQHPPGCRRHASPQMGGHAEGVKLVFGRLKDPALEVLLKSLADQMDGLCVVSSRFPFPDLEGHGGYAPHDLHRLSAEAGAELLRSRGVKGTEEELQAAADEYRGHALALRLLGSYLAMYEGGRIERREALPALIEAEDGGGHAQRVMRAYEQMLDPVERSILHIAGLFDRTADASALAALRDDTPTGSPAGTAAILAALPGLQSGQDGRGPSGKPWRKAVTHLVQLGLLEETEGDDLDAHPLVREHFGTRLRETAPEVWQAAHERLYRHLAAAATYPDTRAALEPLVQAVAHGCAAGLHQEALEQIYLPYIRGGSQDPVPGVLIVWRQPMQELGAFSADLAALAGFFAEPWARPQPSLSEDDQLFLLHQAGFSLSSLNRLAEAVIPREVALERIGPPDGTWHGFVAIGLAVQLSEILTTLGRLEAAAARAAKAVTQADRHRVAWRRLIMLTRTMQADILHQCGRLDAAQALFVEAERLQLEYWPDRYPLLSSNEGYQYGDLLLTRGEIAEARRRAELTLEFARREGYREDVVLDHLLLGRIATKLADFTVAAHHLDAALADLAAQDRDWLPRGLLARAALHRRLTHFDLAHRDLAEAHTIATRGDMRLHLCDYHLESARLHLAQNHLDLAREHHAVAHAGVHAMGYHRRDPELAELAAALGPPRSA